MAEPVALGVAVFIFLRPWRDGLTFPAFNAYYTAFVIALATLWCARAIIRGDPLRYPVPMGLLGGFLVVSFLAGFNSISYDPTHRSLQQIAVYLMLFVTVVNVIRTPRAFTIVLVGMGIGWLVSSLWAMFHFYVMLPGMRQILMGNPQLVQQYFMADGFSPELKNRLESNRAFGTFLFPNALGAYLVLGIPALFVAARESIGRLRSMRVSLVPRGPNAQWFVIGAFFAVCLVVLSVLYFANDFIGTSRADKGSPISGVYRPFLFFLPIAVAAGGAAAWVTSRGGLRRLGEVLAGIGAPIAVLSCAIALWLSYSRGAMVALALAAGFTAIVLFYRSGSRRAVQSAAIVVFGAYALLSSAGFAQDEVEGYRVPDLVPSDLSYSIARYIQSQEGLATLDIEGSQRDIADLGNLESARARVTYWQVGLRMLAAHLWTGVGPGNFKQAFLQHQFLGAGDVEAAHNDYLQYFCETGLAGGALFLAFWVYFGVWGAMRIRREIDAVARRWLAALYMGGLAFALHSLVDFNFQNPSIASLAFVVAGLFYARSAMAESPTEPTGFRSRPLVRTVVAALIAIAILSTASVARTYVFDLGLTESDSLGWRLYYVGDRKPIASRREVARKLLTELAKERPKATTPPYVTVRAALLVIPDLAQLESIGVFRVPIAPGSTTMRPLNPGEEATGETFLFITDRRRTIELTAQHAEPTIKRLEEWDEVYPHDPELASEIFTWYDLLFTHTADPAAKRRYAAKAEHWAREGTERSPEVAWWWLNFAKALWMRGSIEPTAQSLAYYFTGLDYYKHAHELYPASGAIAFRYAQALEQLGAALVGAGRPEDGQRLVTESQAMFKRAELLARYVDLVR